MTRRFITLLLVLCCALTFARRSEAEPIRVVATIFPLADMARRVGGDRVTVTTLLPANASAHTFEPTPSAMRQVAGAQLLAKVGAELDPWVDRLFTGHTSRPKTVVATEGVPLLRAAQQELLHGRHDHDHGKGDDPHVWLDPILVRDKLVPRLVAALSQLNPADAPLFRTNGERFRQELTRLDDDCRRTVASLPRRDFIALHSAWGYLAQRYGLRQIAAVETFPGKEPSARYLAALVSLARRQGVKTIFAEPQLSAKAARTLAAEIGGSVLILDPMGGEKVAGRDSYIGLMRHNLAAIQAGMK
jgi:ABC-type Zn uptake system ZnuABC Zn-binding protein ZnuA